jgi:PHD/YefM family antitoxin component YafN of YafNO toxin-antitoxin module
MSGGCFHTLNLAQFLKVVDDLHGKVAKGHGRVEITVDGCDDVCILISKAELEALERALEILSETGDFQNMSQSLSQVASLTCEIAAAQSA